MTERGVIVGARLAGASVTKKTQLADVSRATGVEGDVGIELQRKDIISKGQQWAEVYTPGS